MADIICKICNQKYKPTFPNPDNTTQGNGCAACIYLSPLTKTWVLRCYYGSSLDLNLYEVLAPELQRDIDPVCDICIASFETNHRIKFIRETLVDSE